MYFSAFCSVGLQIYNLKSPILSLDAVYQIIIKKIILGSDDASQRNKNKEKRKRSQVLSSAPSPVAELSSSESDLSTSESESGMEDQNILVNNFLGQRKDISRQRAPKSIYKYRNSTWYFMGIWYLCRNKHL
jgi:hypothetical protein